MHRMSNLEADVLMLQTTTPGATLMNRKLRLKFRLAH